MKQLFENVFTDGKRLFTLNSSKGIKFFDEELVREDNVEYRGWNPLRSKLAAAIKKGLTNFHLKSNSFVLYLGAAHGYTASFVSDIAADGFVFAVDSAARVMRELIRVAEARRNIIPILSDANQPQQFYHYVLSADIIYQDIAQRNQVEIFLKNCSLFLKSGGYAYLVVKARSIDVVQQPSKIFMEVKRQLEAENSMEVLESKQLEPFQKDHMMLVCRKK